MKDFLRLKSQHELKYVHTNTDVCASGRPQDDQMFSAFNKMCEWLEIVDDGLYTLEDLHYKMKEFSDFVYSLKHLKRKLLDRYTDNIVIADARGKKNVICFTNVASSIFNDKWYANRNISIEDESIRIVTAAAKLLRRYLDAIWCRFGNYYFISILFCSCNMNIPGNMLRKFEANILKFDSTVALQSKN